MNEYSIVIADNLDDIGTEGTINYVAHAYCMGGSCKVTYNATEIVMTEGDLIIVRRGTLVSSVCPSDDFRVKVIYVEGTFLEVCTPQNNYGMVGTLSLFLNPLMHLDEDQRRRCVRNMSLVEEYWTSQHHFKRDMMIATVQALFLDFFDFHVAIYGENNIPLRSADIMRQFLGLLNQGEFRKHRELSYYADKLCVTPKYLSHVCKRVSGASANYWINRYTALDLSRVLRDKSLSLTEIADMFGFSSAAYFTRYVQNNLGMTPTAFRE